MTEDRTIEVKQQTDSGKTLSNTVVIEDGTVSVTHSTCSNQVCVKHYEIDETSESIICLPNKVMVTIEGQGGSEYDSVSS